MVLGSLLPILAITGIGETPIPAVLAFEGKPTAEQSAFMTFKGSLYESYLAQNQKDLISYRKLTSGRFAVAFWGKEFTQKLASRKTFLSAVLKLVKTKKPLQIRSFTAEEQVILSKFISLSTGALPEDGTSLFAGTTTQGFYKIGEQHHSIEMSTSVPKFDMKSFVGLPSFPIKDADFPSIAEEVGDLFSLQQSAAISVQSWVDLVDDSKLNADLGECVKFYLDEKHKKMREIQQLVFSIVQNSEEVPPPSSTVSSASKPTFDELNKLRKAKGFEYRTVEQIKREGVFLGNVKSIDIGIAINLGGQPAIITRSIQITKDWLPKA